MVQKKSKEIYWKEHVFQNDSHIIDTCTYLKQELAFNFVFDISIRLAPFSNQKKQMISFTLETFFNNLISLHQFQHLNIQKALEASSSFVSHLQSYVIPLAHGRPLYWIPLNALESHYCKLLSNVLIFILHNFRIKILSLAQFVV